MKRWKKIILWSASISILLVIASVLITQTRVFKDWLRDLVVRNVNQSLSAELQIERLEGNLFRNVDLRGVHLIRNQDTIFAAPRIEITHSLYRLIFGEIIIPRIDVDSPTVMIRQLNGPTWNFEHLSGDDDVWKILSYDINIRDLTIRGGSIRIESSSPYLPRRLENISLGLTTAYQSHVLSGRLRDVTVTLYHDQMPPVNISFDAEIDSNSVRADSVIMASPRNRLTADMLLVYRGNPGGSIDLRGDHLSLEEFAGILPRRINTERRPDVVVTARLRDDTLTADIKLTDGDQLVLAEVAASGIEGIISDTAPAPRAALRSEFQNLEPALWVQDAGLDMRLTGELHVEGNGRSLASADAQWRVNFHDCLLYGRPVRIAQASGRWNSGKSTFDLKSESASGALNLAGELSPGPIPEYYVAGDLTDFNLKALLPDMPYAPQSDINMHIQARGQGLTRPSLRANLMLRTSPSTVNGIAVDSSYAELTADRGNIALDSFMLAGGGLHLSATGEVTVADSVELRFEGAFANLNYANGFMKRTDLSGTGRIDGEIRGTARSATARVDFGFDGIGFADGRAGIVSGDLSATTSGFTLSSAVMNTWLTDVGLKSATADSVIIHADFTADTFEGNAPTSILPDSAHVTFEYEMADGGFGGYDVREARGKGTGIIGRGQIQSAEGSMELAGAGINEFRIDRITTDAKYAADVINISLAAETEDKLSANIQTDIRLDSIVSVIIPRLDIEFMGDHLQGGSDSSTIVIAGDRYRFSGFTFTGTSESDTSNFVVKISGTAGPDPGDELSATLTGLSLDNIPLPPNAPGPLGGVLSMNLSLHGFGDSQILTGEFSITEGFIRQQQFDELSGTAYYVPDSLDFLMALRMGGQERLVASGYLPVNLAHPDSSWIKPDGHILIGLNAEGFPLAFGAAFTDMLRDAAGSVSSDLKIQNTLQNPSASGTASITDGNIRVPALGIVLDNIQTSIEFDGDRVSIAECRAKSGRGEVDLKGQLMLSDILGSTPGPGNSLLLKASNFTALNRPDLNTLVDAELSLDTESGAARAKGSVEIVEATLWMPAITSAKQLIPGQEDKSIPLLVQAAKGIDTSTVDTVSFFSGGPPSQTTFAGLVRRLEGRITLQLHRNIWIKGKNMMAELSGDLEVVKDSTGIRLFGTVETLRGHATVVGRRFNLTKGTVTFSGEERPNPSLAITGEYKFIGTERQTRILKLNISGNLEDPRISFAIDDRAIDESEAMSYIVFGAGPDELASGNHSGMGDALAMNLASSVASRQLSKTIGEEFGLDYIEIYATDSWQKTSFTAGKYLTPKWFLSYEREFAREQVQETTPVKVTAEYEFTRNISFRLISGNTKERGLDLLLRLERD